jgi:tetratricopeptide (TPR) repeat protein
VAVNDSAKPKAPRIPPPPLDTVQARLAFNKSELATLFHTGLDIRDSARYWYERVLLDHPTSVHAARALYTLTRIYQSDSTVPPGNIDSLFRQLVERFPESEFAAEARRQLGLPPLRTEADPLRTSYAQGESYMKRGDVDSALSSFKRIVQRDTSSQLSAQSEYAIGWIYENLKLNADSSLAYYQRLVKRFPNSQYTMMVQPKLAEVAAESQRKNQPTGPDTTVAPPVLKEEELPTVKMGSPGEKAAATDSLGKKEPTEGPMNKRTDEDNPKP